MVKTRRRALSTDILHFSARVVVSPVGPAATSGRPTPNTTSRPTAALVHESDLARSDPTPQTFHLPVAYDAGLPSRVIRLRMLHAITASVTRPPGERARRPPPMIALYRKKAFSTLTCR